MQTKSQIVNEKLSTREGMFEYFQEKSTFDQRIGYTYKIIWSGIAHFVSCEHCLPYSLVPRLHPLTRRNRLVNLVKFLGLPDTFATVSPTIIQNILCQTCSIKLQILEWKWTNFSVVSATILSCNLIGTDHFWEISSKNSTLFTRQFLTGRHALARHKYMSSLPFWKTPVSW